MIGGKPWDGTLNLSPDERTPLVDQFYWRLQFDLAWVFSTFIRILGKSNKPVAFDVNRTQRWVLWNILDQQSLDQPVRLWILKGRQFGMTTFFMMRALILATIHYTNNLLLVHQEKPGQTMMRRADTVLSSSPEIDIDGETFSPFKKPDKWDAGNLMFWKSGVLNSLIRRESAENRDAAVGETYQHVHLSEVPLYPDPDHTLSGLLPTIPSAPGTSIVGEFTARSVGDYTHQIWIRSTKRGSAYRAIFLPWYWHEEYFRAPDQDDYVWTPEERRFRDMVASIGFEYPLTESGALIRRLRTPFDRDGTSPHIDDLRTGFALSDAQMLWRRDKLDELKGDIDKFNREYPVTPEVAYQSGGRRVVSPRTMDKVEAHARAPLSHPQGVGEYIAHMSTGKRVVARWLPAQDGRVHRWEMPRANATYVVWADPSSGAGADPSGCGIFRVEYNKLVLVLSFVGHERPHELARLLSRFGRHYRDGASRSSNGKLTGGRDSEIVVERNGFGEHVIHELTQTLGYKRVWRMTNKGRDDYKQGHQYGFPTTRTSKMPMLQHLAKLLYDDALRVYDRRVIEQLRMLQYLDDDDKTAGAPPGAHDDLAMGIGVGAFAATQKGVFRFKPVHNDPRIKPSDQPPMFGT